MFNTETASTGVIYDIVDFHNIEDTPVTTQTLTDEKYIHEF